MNPVVSLSARPLAARLCVRLCLASFALALAACGTMNVEPKKIDYKSAGKAPSLETPPDLVTPTQNDRYAVPDTGGKGSATWSGYTTERTPEARAARPSNVLPDVQSVRFERDGNERWLSVDIPRDKLWGQVKDFWQDHGFILSLDMPEAGVMETDWAENRAKVPQDFIRESLGKFLDSIYSTGERDKFRTRFEAGSTPGTTDIFISHRGMVESYVGKQSDYQTVWEPRPVDPELEAEFLRRLMVSLGASEERAVAELARTQEKKTDRASLQTTGNGLLEVQEPFDRAWRRVGLALDRVGFTVEDRDRANGLYFVRYVDPESDQATKKDEGFLSKLAFWRSSKQDIDTRAQYRILVKGAGDLGQSTTVQVLSREGGPENSQTARKILSLLQEQLK
ncbi:MAG: outer membrane protein assembly factor BamC [Betaproteobacteria bacterium]|nr:outer membrane protein assembly factor BamC [Betaproteobacteria bacterium]